MRKIVLMFLMLVILLSACDAASTQMEIPFTETPSISVNKEPAAPTEEPLQEVTLGAGRGLLGTWFEIYFTDPSSPLASQRTGGVDAPLAAAIDSARLSVDVAIYSLSLNSVRDALINAHKRGVRVRMVMESDNLDRSDPQRLKDAGIPILGDRREGLMHNKFAVIDNVEVWLGSMNFTDSGAYDDDNHLMRIRSKKLAENFTKEFEEMFIDDKFGQDVVAATPNPRVTIDGTPIDIYFSPDDKVQASLLDLLDTAQESIFFMAFSFTSDEIGGLMRKKAKDDKLSVFGVMDDEQIKSNVGTEFDPFKQASLNVRRDGNAGQMHHKVIIIDQQIVVLGSYNFTNSAEVRNDENLLVIYNKAIALFFVDEFQKIYKMAR